MNLVKNIAELLLEALAIFLFGVMLLFCLGIYIGLIR